MIDDAEMDGMRAIADRIRHEAECVQYGYFPGGDPREFTPDEESCSEEEIQKWKDACEQWNAGIQKDIGGPHIPIGDFGHLTVAHYGLGSYTYRDEALTSIAQDLDDLLDRIRPVSR